MRQEERVQVGTAGEVVALERDPQRGLRGALLGDVPHDGGEHGALTRLDLGDRDLRDELGAVGPEQVGLDPGRRRRRRTRRAGPGPDAAGTKSP